MTVTAFLLALGATLRLVRFFGRDTLAHPIRVAVLKRSSWLHELVTCPWCLSIWVAAAVVACAGLFGHTAWFWGPAAALSISYLCGLAQRHLDPDEE